MTAPRFDVVLIGAGPSAVAALGVIDRGASIAVVSGETTQSPSTAELHPKIQTVSLENREAPAVANAYARAHDPKKPLFSSAGAGGLANYWGQQFVRYEPSDPWPAAVFPDHHAYVQACEAVERSFFLSGGEGTPAPRPLADGYRLRVPRLLVGSPQTSQAGLMTMRGVFQAEADARRAHVLRTRVRSVRRHGAACEVVLEDGEILRAGQVLLSAGVIGTARIVQESFPDVRRLRFSDHAPWMIYAIGLGGLFRRRPPTALRHFNALTLEKAAQDSIVSFSSLYDMGRAELNLLLASTLGRSFKLFRRLGAPPGASLLNPVQVWTPRTFDQIEIEAKTGVASSVTAADTDPGSDEALAEVETVLRSMGGRLLKISRTPPGYGFHYHGLEVEASGAAFTPIADLLHERSGGKILCADASVLPRIGVRPHTLTAMAASRQIVTNSGL